MCVGARTRPRGQGGAARPHGSTSTCWACALRILLAASLVLGCVGWEVLPAIQERTRAGMDYATAHEAWRSLPLRRIVPMPQGATGVVGVSCVLRSVKCVGKVCAWKHLVRGALERVRRKERVMELRQRKSVLEAALLSSGIDPNPGSPSPPMQGTSTKYKLRFGLPSKWTG